MLKGQCHEIFCFWFFSWISFPPAPEYSLKTVSNFFENSRRYSQLKVCHRCQRHRWQMEKIFSQKNFNNFVWSPLGCRGNIYINFCLQVHFQVSAAWYCSHYLPPVSMTPVANLPPVSLILVAICHRRRCHRRRCHRRQICPRYRWHRWQICFATGVNNTRRTGGKICRRCRWHRWCTLTCEYLHEFSKKFEMILMLLSGA